MARPVPEGSLDHSAIASLVGLATTDQIGFYGVTAVSQQAGASQAAVTATSTATGFGFATSAELNNLVSLVNAMQGVLVNLGLMKGGA